MSVLVVLFPHYDDLLDREIADLIVVVLQMQHAIFNFGNFAPDAGGSAAKGVDFLPISVLRNSSMDGDYLSPLRKVICTSGTTVSSPCWLRSNCNRS